MGKIKKLLESELIGGSNQTEIYPITSTKAIYDKNNEVLDDIIKTINNKSDITLSAIKEVKVVNPVFSTNGAGYTAAGSTAGNGWSKSDYIPISYGDKIEYNLDGWGNYCIIALFDADKQRIVEGHVVGTTGIYSGYNHFKSGVFINNNSNVKFAIVQTRQETVETASVKVTNYINTFIDKKELEDFENSNNAEHTTIHEEITNINNSIYSFTEEYLTISNTSGNGIAYSSGSNAGSGHYTTSKIVVSEGDSVEYTLSEASNFCMIGAWKDGVYSQVDSVAGIGTLTSNTYIVPKGVTELKFGTNLYEGSSIKFIKRETEFALKEDLDKISTVNTFNPEIDEHLIAEVCGKFYGERALAHSKYLTSESKTVYVDTVEGDDSNSGLSQNTPIQSLTKANEILYDGDTLLIKRGSKFISKQTINKNGIIIDCYGDSTQEKPISYNLIDITESSSIEKVEGYNNIYRIAWENDGALGSDRAGIQVFIDGMACGDWTIYTGYNPSNYDIITQDGAMQYLDANVNNAAWCDAYLDGGFSKGWSAGTNYIYFAVSFDPTNQAILNSHKIQITRCVGQLIEFLGVDIDLRNFIWQTICFNVVTPCRYNENVDLYNFVRHGFHYTNSWFMNCKTDVLEGIGKHYHYQPKNDQTFYEEIIIVGCKAISRRKDRQGELFDGHGTNTSQPVLTYNRAFVINCYVENLLFVIDAPNVANIYIKNMTLKNCASIGVIRKNTIIDGVFGSLYPTGSKQSIITPPLEGDNGILKNVHLQITSDKGGIFFMYDVDSGKRYGNLLLQNACILIRKLSENEPTYELATTFAFWNGNSNFKFKSCTFGCKHDSGVKENFARESDNITNFSLMQFEDCVIAGITNNKNINNANIKWVDNVESLFTLDNLLRLMYVYNGEVKVLNTL